MDYGSWIGKYNVFLQRVLQLSDKVHWKEKSPSAKPFTFSKINIESFVKNICEVLWEKQRDVGELLFMSNVDSWM